MPQAGHAFTIALSFEDHLKLLGMWIRWPTLPRFSSSTKPCEKAYGTFQMWIAPWW